MSDIDVEIEANMVLFSQVLGRKPFSKGAIIKTLDDDTPCEVIKNEDHEGVHIMRDGSPEIVQRIDVKCLEKWPAMRTVIQAIIDEGEHIIKSPSGYEIDLKEYKEDELKKITEYADQLESIVDKYFPKKRRRRSR